MSDSSNAFDHDLSGLDWQGWTDALDTAAGDDGYAEPLGEKHAAVLIENKPILLVTFENAETIAARSATAQPLGWQMARALGWSHLGLICNGDTWFRDRHVYGYFDRLADDGFFDDFDQVIFYGVGACGYAAAAFSVAAPGAKVLALQPQATLDPRIAEWDDRFADMRRTDFTDRYGFAPDMLDAAAQAFILYDPEDDLDAMHAALFTRPNVTKFRMRHLGPDLEASLLHMRALFRILAQLSAGKLNRLNLARLYRARRDNVGYLKRVLVQVEQSGHIARRAKLTNGIMNYKPGPRFRRSLREAHRLAGEQGITLPDSKFV